MRHLRGRSRDRLTVIAMLTCVVSLAVACSSESDEPTAESSTATVIAADEPGAGSLTLGFADPPVGVRAEIDLVVSAQGGGEVELTTTGGWCRLEGATAVPTGTGEIRFEGEVCTVVGRTTESGEEESITIVWRPTIVRGTWTQLVVGADGDRRHQVTFRADDRLYQLRYGTGCSGPRYVGDGETIEIVGTGTGTVCEINGVPHRIDESTYAIADTLSFPT